MTAPSYAPLPVSWVLHGQTLAGVDEHGCRWITQRTRGWRGTSAPRTNRSARPTGSGSTRGQSYRDERIITLSGITKCPTAAARADAEERLAQLIPDEGDLVVLRRTGENGLPQIRYVELDDALDLVPTGRVWFGWDIQLAAPDPRKFAPDWTTSTPAAAATGSGGIVSTGSGIVSTGSGIAAGTAERPAAVTATGGGGVDNPLVFELRGPLGGDGETTVITDVSGTSQLRYRGALGDGESAFLNTDAHPAHGVPGAAGSIPGRGALVGAAAVNSAVGVTGGWPTLPAGATRSYVMAGPLGPGAQLVVHSRPAWN